MAPELTPHQILAAARMVIFKRAPYFRAGVLSLVPRESPGFGTFATTKDWIMLWDPEVVSEYGIEGTAAVIVHELFHCLQDHWGRFDQPMINKDIANIASDLSVNPSVRDMGFQFPVGEHEGLWPVKFGLEEGLTSEEYYNAILKMDVQYKYYDADAALEHGIKLPGMSVHVEGCGSCSGRERPDEPRGDAQGRSEGEIRRTRVTIARAVRSAQRGTVPSDLARWADQQLRPPKVRWQDKFARLCRAAIAFRPGAGHSTYSRVSRRQAGLGFGPGRPVIPSYRATQPRVKFLVDTSGSMQAEQLALIMAEARGVFDACGASLDLVVCDAAVHGMKKVRSVKEACAMLRGGGGSDFRPAFEAIARERPKCDIIVAATDGYIAVPEEEPPGTKVIWLLVATPYSENNFQRPAQWGETIEVDDE